MMRIETTGAKGSLERKSIRLSRVTTYGVHRSYLCHFDPKVIVRAHFER